MNQNIRQYLRQVRRWLPCTSRTKKQIMNKITDTMVQYVEVNPEPCRSEIIDRFGTPQQIAAAYVEEMDTAQLLHDLRIRRRVLATVIAGVLVVVLLLAATLTAIWADAHNSIHGEVTDKIEYVQ